MDRTNIGNARLAGMEEDLNMSESGSDYNMSLTIFFISYAVAEPITNTLLKRLTPRIFFTGIILLWGLIMTLMGLVTNYSGLLAARWFLGIAEAGLFPGTYSAQLLKASNPTDISQELHTTYPAGTKRQKSASAAPSSSLPQPSRAPSAVSSQPPSP